VAITNQEVESWRLEDASPSGMDGAELDLGHPLSPPPEDLPYLTIHVRIKPPVQDDARAESGVPEILEEKWQDLEARWNAILGLEVSMDSIRQRMEGIRTEMEASSRRTLNTEEKLHALNADVIQWNKAKSRVHYALPKVREFIHRATWAIGTPERKKLEELFKNDIRNLPLEQLDKVREQLDYLLKDRQVLSAQGMTVYQECQTITADIQGALRTLQNSAAANARKNREASRKKGKFI
jgi:uncharacterized protein YoxC